MSIDPKNYWQDDSALPLIDSTEFEALKASLSAPRDREILEAFIEAYHAEAAQASRQARDFDIQKAVAETVSASLSGAAPKKIASWFPHRFEKPVAAPLQIHLSLNGFTGEMWRAMVARLDAGDRKMLRTFIAAFDTPGDGKSLNEAAIEVSIKLLSDYRSIARKIQNWFTPPPAPKVETAIIAAATATTKPRRGRQPKPKTEPANEPAADETRQEDTPPPPPEPPAPPPEPPAPPVETAKKAGRDVTARAASNPNEPAPAEEKADAIKTPQDLLLVARRVADSCNKKSLTHYARSIKHNLAAVRSAVKRDPTLINLGNFSLMLNLLSQHLLLNEGPHRSPQSPYSIGRSILTTVKFMSELHPDMLQANPILKERLHSLTAEHGHICSPDKPLHHDALLLLAEWRTLKFSAPANTPSMPHSSAKEDEGWHDQHISRVYGGGERARPRKPAPRPHQDRSDKPKRS
ncbi:MAG: hypothetical protein P4M15_11780 [Alphaproteobacteria bacterium]|nr:hypothetical protein [Alphaproteobacteria bacterium]